MKPANNDLPGPLRDALYPSEGWPSNPRRQEGQLLADNWPTPTNQSNIATSGGGIRCCDIANDLTCPLPAHFHSPFQY